MFAKGSQIEKLTCIFHFSFYNCSFIYCNLYFSFYNFLIFHLDIKKYSTGHRDLWSI